MSKYYTDEPHAQIVLALLKEHNIRKIVISPGATNIPIAGSIQIDPFFQVYSCVDERSAAYMACGLAEESGEPVVISCTGATASRNYMPGLTEAYYRKLPIIALTSFNGNKYIGNLMPQNLDRTVIPNDIARLSVQLPVIKDLSDRNYCNLLVNRAILETSRGGGGPVHINLTTTYAGTFTTKELPPVRVIKRLCHSSNLPKINGRKIAFFIGSHKRFSKYDVEAIENFCSQQNAVVLCDHTSSYHGKYRIQSALITSNLTKISSKWNEIKPEIVFHLGEVSGDYPTSRVLEECQEVWRVSEDGEVRDRGGKLRYVYEGSISSLLEKLEIDRVNNDLYDAWKSIDSELRTHIPELPYSNAWIASELSNSIPRGSFIHLAILNSLRCWNLFEVDNSVLTSSNVGGFGIDGCVSTLVGASLNNKEKLYFGIIGDLAFFYDINVIANRHLGGNVRILLINNGCGAEFNVSSHIGSQFGSDSNEYIAAGGHFASGDSTSGQVLSSGSRSQKSLAKSWSETLGIEYISSTSKSEFKDNINKFLDINYGQSIIFECFTDSDLESEALSILANLNPSKKEKAVKTAKKVLPSKVTRAAKSVVSKLIK